MLCVLHLLPNCRVVVYTLVYLDDGIIVKLRERKRHRVDQGKKRKKWMVDILSLMLYTKFG